MLDKVTCKNHCFGQIQKRHFRPLFLHDFDFFSTDIVDISNVWVLSSIVLAWEAQIKGWKSVACPKSKTADNFFYHTSWLLIALTTQRAGLEKGEHEWVDRKTYRGIRGQILQGFTLSVLLDIRPLGPLPKKRERKEKIRRVDKKKLSIKTNIRHKT